MTQEIVISVLRDAIYTVVVSSAPMLIAAIVIGLIVSIFQATTQINEQTLAFVPKIIGIFLVFLLFLGFILNNINDFTVRLFASINTFIR